MIDRAYESVAWDNTTVGSAQTGGKLQKKISTSSLRGNLLFDSVDDMDSEELDPIEYSLREESGLAPTHAKVTGVPHELLEYLHLSNNSVQ